MGFNVIAEEDVLVSVFTRARASEMASSNIVDQGEVSCMRCRYMLKDALLLQSATFIRYSSFPKNQQAAPEFM
jgi:hypothetical protein